MKIVSKYKDYYDFLMGVKGIDPLRRYEPDRKRLTLSQEIESIWKLYAFDYYEICVDGKSYECVPTPKGVLYADDLLYTTDHEVNKERGTVSVIIYGKKVTLRIVPADTTINEELNKPILAFRSGYYRSAGTDHKWQFGTDNKGAFEPILKDFSFHKVMSAEDVWNKVIDFLSKEKPVVDTRTDKQKIAGAGFDLKTSFRKM